MTSVEAMNNRIADMETTLAHCQSKGNYTDAEEIMQRITKAKRDLFILKTTD